jgi:hypothetical protein
MARAIVPVDSGSAVFMRFIVCELYTARQCFISEKQPLEPYNPLTLVFSNPFGEKQKIMFDNYVYTLYPR